MRAPFLDRLDAGHILAQALSQYGNQPDVLVLGLPRGGVPVAHEVALALGAPLDVFVVRKLGVPGYQEAAFGAIASGGVRVLDPMVVAHLHIADSVIEQITRKERVELERREEIYRSERRFSRVEGQTVILVDDGIATGASMYAAVEALRQERPARIIVAAPVASPSAIRMLSKVADDCVCVIVPEAFHAVGLWYEDFTQTSNEEVRRLLNDARARTLSVDASEHALSS
jgi:predicted phosphoribosyltransferase